MCVLVGVAFNAPTFFEDENGVSVVRRREGCGTLGANNGSVV